MARSRSPSAATTNFETKAKTAVQVAPAEPKQPASDGAEHPYKKPKPAQKELASVPGFFTPSADHSTDEGKPVAPFTEANCSLKAESKTAAPFIEVAFPPKTDSMKKGCRRKDVMEPPAKLSERIDSAAKTEDSGDRAAVPKQDPDFYKDWAGGSRYELDSKPWNILGWFVRGIENRLHKK